LALHHRRNKIISTLSSVLKQNFFNKDHNLALKEKSSKTTSALKVRKEWAQTLTGKKSRKKGFPRQLKDKSTQMVKKAALLLIHKLAKRICNSSTYLLTLFLM